MSQRSPVHTTNDVVRVPANPLQGSVTNRGQQPLRSAFKASADSSGCGHVGPRLRNTRVAASADPRTPHDLCRTVHPCRGGLRDHQNRNSVSRPGHTVHPAASRICDRALVAGFVWFARLGGLTAQAALAPTLPPCRSPDDGRNPERRVRHIGKVGNSSHAQVTDPARSAGDRQSDFSSR
jgi:hypothetical protein